MKISEIKGERALEVVADLIDPISVIIADEKVKEAFNSGNKANAAKYLLKNHKKSCLTILALLNGEEPETYEPSLLQLPRMLLDLFEDPDVMSLFGLQTQSMELASSGSATENTEAPEA